MSVFGMDKPQRPSRLDCQGEAGYRRLEGRAAVEQMLAENREGLGMKVIAIMVQRYGVLPKELWDLNSISDMGAGRGINITMGLSKSMYERITSNSRYRIISLTLARGSYHGTIFPRALRRLTILADDHTYCLDPLPETLQELAFGQDCGFRELLVLPKTLRKLKLPTIYNLPIVFPPESELLELELGVAYNCALALPPGLKRLAFVHSSNYNLPLTLPLGLVGLQLGDAYNQPIVLPFGIKELRVGQGFTHDLLLPNGLRKIEWCCNRPIRIPEGVFEVEFNNRFKESVVFSSTVKKATFAMNTYSLPLALPSGLEELIWSVGEHDALVLPESLRKLTWASEKNVRLPSRLRELILAKDVPSLVLPEGLLKFSITFEHRWQRPCYMLPESVQEVVWSNGFTFTYPTTLQHLIVTCTDKVDLPYHIVRKVTIASRYVSIKEWPQGLEELAFPVDIDRMAHPLRVPKGFKIVGGKLPENVTME